MAITKLLYMKDCGKGFPGKHLKAALDYISDVDKTQGGRLIAGVNCRPGYAYEQMRDTKQKFGKTDKRQAYHLIISFQEGEIDADTAFEVTEKFVKEYLGDSYEAVYTVHDNTAHIHSHIVFNSVSFTDGRKYRYEKGDWEKYIRPITERLCKEYGLSVFEFESEKVRSDEKISEWDDSKHGPFVWSNMIRRDLDSCIVLAEDFSQFEQLLIEKGYLIQRGKYFAVKPPGMARYRRCKTLGEDYSEDRIRARIQTENLSTYKVETLEEAERVVYSQIPRGRRAKLTGLQKRYYAKLYRLGLLKRKPYSKAWKYKDEIREMHKIQEQYLFLINHDIESVSELQAKSQSLAQEKKSISKDKSKAYRSKKKCEELFDIAELMSEIFEREQAYQSGETFFEREHEAWMHYEAQLSKQGYSYEEVVKLQTHYDNEIARIRKLEREIAREQRIAELLVMELHEEEQKFEIKQEQEKKEVRTQPTR